MSGVTGREKGDPEVQAQEIINKSDESVEDLLEGTEVLEVDSEPGEETTPDLVDEFGGGPEDGGGDAFDAD